jgi:hypothetical protein
MAKRADSGFGTALAIGVFVIVLATWLFIHPSVIRGAWMAERGEVYALAGEGEHRVFGQVITSLQQTMSRDFQNFLLDADAMGQGQLGNVGFSQWTRSRIEATWLWLGLVIYRLHVLMGWLLPGIPLAIVAYLDGHYVREIRKFSFVAQSPIRHKLGIRVMWVVLIGLAAWLLVPVPLPAIIAPTLTVAISYSLWLWVSNLQKRL